MDNGFWIVIWLMMMSSTIFMTTEKENCGESERIPLVHKIYDGDISSINN